MLTGRVFIDTNVLVYAYDDAEPTKRDRARGLIADESIDVVISAQVLSEFYVTLTRKLATNLDDDEVAGIVDQLGDLHVVPTTRNLVAEATRASIRHQISYCNALIVAAASAGGAGSIATEDLQAGATILGVTIVNPFE